MSQTENLIETPTAPKRAPRKKAQSPDQSTDVREMVAVRAYFLAEQGGFDPSREMDFWLQAESETLAAAAPAKPKAVRKPRAKKAE